MYVAAQTVFQSTPGHHEQQFEAGEVSRGQHNETNIIWTLFGNAAAMQCNANVLSDHELTLPSTVGVTH